MKITNRQIYNEASAILRSLYGESACFRDGQYEAIEATLLNRRTLVVQRTGWGKSLVYFACTKLLRNRGAGTTFVVSPLLVLMQNQIEAAERMGLRCEALNSQTKDRREEVLSGIIDGEIDFATPYMVPGYRMLCELEPRLQEGVNTSFDIFPMRYHSIGHWHLSLYNFLQKVF